MTKRWEPLLIAGTFLTCLVTAGHGIVPLAALLIASNLYMTAYGIFGLLAVGLLVAAAIAGGSTRKMFTILGSLIALGVWIAFLFVSDPVANTIFFSVHFLASLVFVLVYRPTAADVE